jgi:hypothetical protein
MATNEQTDKAITAVRNGVATREQEEIAARAAKTVGERGNKARDAFNK